MLTAMFSCRTSRAARGCSLAASITGVPCRQWSGRAAACWRGLRKSAWAVLFVTVGYQRGRRRVRRAWYSYATWQRPHPRVLPVVACVVASVCTMVQASGSFADPQAANRVVCLYDHGQRGVRSYPRRCVWRSSWPSRQEASIGHVADHLWSSNGLIFACLVG